MDLIHIVLQSIAVVPSGQAVTVMAGFSSTCCRGYLPMSLHRDCEYQIRLVRRGIQGLADLAGENGILCPSFWA